MGRALVDQALQQAVRHHRGGDLAQAEAIYRQILAIDPNHPDATHLLGLVAHASGRSDDAVELMQRAIAHVPGVPHYHANLGNALRETGRSAEAIAAYEHAIALGDASPEVRNNLGIVLLRLGRDAQAAACFEASLALRPPTGPDRAGTLCNLASALTHLGQHPRAVEVAAAAALADPGLAAAHAALGSALSGAARYAEARASFGQAVALAPNMPEAYLGLADVLGHLHEHAAAVHAAAHATRLRPKDHAAWTALGVALLGDHRREDAVAAFAKATAILPGFSPAYANMGVAISELGRHAEAVDVLRQASDLAPDDPMPLRNLAIAFLAMHADDRALDAATRALALDPTCTTSGGLYSGIKGHALERAGRFDEALAAYEQAAVLAPEAPLHAVRLATMLLRLGQFDRGWSLYEHRLDYAFSREQAHGFALPRWTRAAAKPTDTVILAAEQGFGDTLQFVRFAASLRHHCARVIIHARPELLDVLRTVPGVDEAVPTGAPLPRADAFVSMMSLPHELGFDLSTVGTAVPYLAPDMVSSALWRRKIDRLCSTTDAPARALRVGIVWAGNPEYPEDADRSIPGPTLLPLAMVPGITWFSLQKGRGLADLASLQEAGWPIHDLGSRCATFADTAAVLANLDLVIAVDTAVAHLAAALGKHVWLLNRFVPDWRWLDGRDDSPWYPTMRLFRQRNPRDWGGLLASVHRELSAASASRASDPM